MLKLVCVFAAAAAVLSASASQSSLPPAIQGLSKLIGGKWVATIGEGASKVSIEYEFEWHPDKKGIVGKGIIGKDTAKPVYATVTLGWDAKAGKVFYLDTHNTESIYYGHVTPDGDGFLYEFGVLGGEPKAYRSRDRFVGDDVRESVIFDKSGSPIVKYLAKRIR